MATKSKTCLAPECGRLAWAYELCHGHWLQQSRGEEFHELRAYRINARHTCARHAPGTTTCYNRCACRCGKCSAANTRARKRTKVRKTSYVIDATGTRRRLQALAALGWGTMTLAAMTGIHPRYLPDLRAGRVERVTPQTAVKVREAYSRLCMKVPTAGTPQSRGQTRARARRNGWAGPLAWDNIDDPNEAPVGMDWSPRTAHWVDVDEVIKLAEAGVILEEISRRMGKSASGIEKKLRKAGHDKVIDRLLEDRRERHRRGKEATQPKVA